MDAGLLITTILGSGGFFALIQFLVARHDNKDSRLSRIERKVDASLEKGERNELAITRFQLLFLILMQPTNKDTILKTAQRYFMELDGNGEAWDAFKHWSDQNGVDSSYYQSHISKKRR